MSINTCKRVVISSPAEIELNSLLLLLSLQLLICVELEMPQTINVQKITDFIEAHAITSEFEHFFKQISIQSRYKYLGMAQSSLKQVALKINNQKTIKRNKRQQTKSNFWKKGEFKLFVWFAAFYAFKLQISILQIRRKDFEFFSKIFLKRCPERMEYEFKSLFRQQKNLRSKWEPKEIELFQKIVQAYQTNNKEPEWKSIAYKLYIESQGTSFKTFGQCRQMWTNHLNLSIKKEKWSEQQDQLLLQLVRQTNKHWSRIAEKFEGRRSCHMVKNRYRQLIKNQQKAEKLKQSDIFNCLQPISTNKLSQQTFKFLSPSSLLTQCQLTKNLSLLQRNQATKSFSQKKNLEEQASEELSYKQDSLFGPTKMSLTQIQQNKLRDEYLIENDVLRHLRWQHYEEYSYQLQGQQNYSSEEFIQSYL